MEVQDVEVAVVVEVAVEGEVVGEEVTLRRLRPHQLAEGRRGLRQDRHPIGLDFGEAEGDNRAHTALERALRSPLMDRGSMLADAANVPPTRTRPSAPSRASRSSSSIATTSIRCTRSCRSSSDVSRRRS